MFFATTLVSLAAFVAAVHGADTTTVSDFKVKTPKDIASCKPVNFTWEATKGPYNLIIVKSSDPCGSIIADLGDHKSNHYLWNADLPVGSYSLSIEDAKGDEGWSGAFDVKTNTKNTTCKYSTVYSPNTSTTDTGAGAAAASPSDDPAVAVGAAGDGILSSAALSARQLATPAVALSALIAAIALSI